MKDNETFAQIDPPAFNAALKEYPDVVPSKLNELDEQRYNIIPHVINDRKEDAHLTKSEVAKLVEWKLSHGKWRPMLQGLVQRNADSVVQDMTRDAFKAFASSNKSAAQAKQVVNTLTKLQGIGPATASLLLSVFDPEAAPFFSDELFRWSCFEDGRGKGWDREIKYNVKEYLELYGRIQEIRERFKKDFDRDVSAVEIEKVAYVLGKTATVSDQSSSGKKRKAETGNRGPVRKPLVASDDIDVKGTMNSHKSNVKTKPVSNADHKPVPASDLTAAASRPKRAKKSS